VKTKFELKPSAALPCFAKTAARGRDSVLGGMFTHTLLVQFGLPIIIAAAVASRIRMRGYAYSFWEQLEGWKECNDRAYARPTII
jgi:hypothetical protein